MKLTNHRNPSVVAGLAAALTLGVTLVAAPAPAIAEEVSAEAPVAGERDEALPLAADAPATPAAPGDEQPQGLAPEATGAAPGTPAGDVTGGGATAPGEAAPAQTGADDQGPTPGDEGDALPDVTEPEGPAELVPGDASDDVPAGADPEATADADADPGADAEPEDADPEATVAEGDAEATEPGEAETGEVELAAQTPHWVKGSDGSYRWYGADGAPQRSGWLVTDVAPDNTTGQGLQRYWLGDSGSLVTGLFEAALDGVSSWFFGTDSGWVARGRYVDPSTGYVYLADNDGRLAPTGWVVSDAYGQGLQRYWIDEDAHAARPGFSEDGWAHYTTSAGYVARGAVTESDGSMRMANNDGLLQKSGWLVTDAFGQGLQRYWVDDYEVAKGRLVSAAEAGWDAFATAAGYVARGAVTDKATGYVYLADNDGRLAPSGWVVSDAYGQGFQRYWVDADARAAVPGLSLDGWAHYTTSAGYVLRGASTSADGTMRWADNDGRLMNSGWLVTDAFGQGLQRYWLSGYEVAKGRLVSAAEAGWAAYATPQGYVLRGSTRYGEGVLLADNDGRLETRTGWVVGSAFGQGLQRYFLSRSADGGYSYAKIDFFRADLGSYVDAWFYGDTTYGYVVRGKTKTSNGLLISNNDGVLAESLFGLGEGFWTTDQIDGSAQVYYLARVNGHYYARTGVFGVGGKQYFGRPNEGYLVRGKTRYGSGMIIAAADGALFFQGNDGWVVTDAVDGALQRYYVVTLEDGVRGARLGLFSVDGYQYYGREDQGYVVRGSYTAPDGHTYYADDDGRLSYAFLTKAGWDAWNRVRSYSGGMYSFTQYLLVVDTTNNRTVVFQGSYIPSLGWYGNWAPLYDWSCSTGSKIYHNGQGTPTGIYRIGYDNADYNWNESGNFTPGGYRTTYWALNDVRYFTGFILNLGFHSTIGWEGGYSDPSQLGKSITHGCIRLAEDAARWIYNNALVGTKVWVY